MPDVSGSVGELAGAIRAMFGLSRPNRLREHIRETVELYGALAEHEELAPAANNVAEALKLQTAKLLAVQQGKQRAPRQWSSIIVATLLAGLCGWFSYVLWPLGGSWSVAGFVLSVIVGSLMAIAIFGMFLPNDEDA